RTSTVSPSMARSKRSDQSGAASSARTSEHNAPHICSAGLPKRGSERPQTRSNTIRSKRSFDRFVPAGLALTIQKQAGLCSRKLSTSSVILGPADLLSRRHLCLSCENLARRGSDVG